MGRGVFAESVKNTAAVKLALSKWCHWLEGTMGQFEIWIDHKKIRGVVDPQMTGGQAVAVGQFFSQSFSLYCITYLGKNFLVMPCPD